MKKRIKIGPAIIDLFEDGGFQVAQAHIPTKEGDITIIARAREALIRQLPITVSGETAYVAGYHMPAAYLQDEVGGFFSSLTKAFKRITKSKAFRTAISVTNGVINNPVFGPIASMVPGVGPLLAAGGPMIGSAANLALRAGMNDAAAQKRVKGIMKLANQGNPEALKAVAALQGVRLAAKKARRAGPRAVKLFNLGINQAILMKDQPEGAEMTPVEPEVMDAEYDDEVGAFVVQKQPSFRMVFGYQPPVLQRKKAVAVAKQKPVRRPAPITRAR